MTSYNMYVTQGEQLSAFLLFKHFHVWTHQNVLLFITSVYNRTWIKLAIHYVVITSNWGTVEWLNVSFISYNINNEPQIMECIASLCTSFALLYIVLSYPTMPCPALPFNSISCPALNFNNFSFYNDKDRMGPIRKLCERSWEVTNYTNWKVYQTRSYTRLYWLCSIAEHIKAA